MSTYISKSVKFKRLVHERDENFDTFKYLKDAHIKGYLVKGKSYNIRDNHYLKCVDYEFHTSEIIIMTLTKYDKDGKAALIPDDNFDPSINHVLEAAVAPSNHQYASSTIFLAIKDNCMAYVTDSMFYPSVLTMLMSRITPNEDVKKRLNKYFKILDKTPGDIISQIREIGVKSLALKNMAIDSHEINQLNSEESLLRRIKNSINPEP